MLHPSPQMKSRNTSSFGPDEKSKYFIPRWKVEILYPQMKKSKYFILRPGWKVEILHPSPQMKSRNTSSPDKKVEILHPSPPLAPDEKPKYFIPRPRWKKSKYIPLPITLVRACTPFCSYKLLVHGQNTTTCLYLEDTFTTNWLTQRHKNLFKCMFSSACYFF